MMLLFSCLKNWWKPIRISRLFSHNENVWKFGIICGLFKPTFVDIISWNIRNRISYSNFIFQLTNSFIRLLNSGGSGRAACFAASPSRPHPRSGRRRTTSTRGRRRSGGTRATWSEQPPTGCLSNWITARSVSRKPNETNVENRFSKCSTSNIV